MSVVGAAMVAAGIGISLLSFGWATPVGVALIGAGVSMLVGGVVLYNYDFDIPGAGSSKGPVTRPGIKGSKNSERPYGYVPVVFGRHLVVPDLAAHSYISIEGNNEYLVQLFCAGYNDISIERDSYKIGDMKLTELSATKNIDQILAGNDSIIRMELLSDGGAGTIYPRRVKPVEIGLQVKQTLDDGSSGATTFTTPGGTTHIAVNLSFPQGLFGLNNKGDEITVYLRVRLLIKPAGEPDASYTAFGYIAPLPPYQPPAVWVPDYDSEGFPTGGHYEGPPAIPYPPEVVGAASRAARYYSVSKDVNPGAWTVKIENGGAYNDNAKYRYDTLYALSANCFFDETPVSADARARLQLIALRVKATDRMSNIIDNFNFTAQAVIPVYSGHGSGPSAWSAAATQNPAAALLYVLRGQINRKPVEDQFIDWPVIEAFSAWCEAHQYYCSAVLGDKMILMNLLSQICLTARAVPVKRDGLFSLMHDIERGSHTQLFTQKNTVDYTQSLEFAETPQALELGFIDEASGWQDEIRIVYNTPSGEKEDADPSDFQAAPLWGVTNARQAFLLGRYNFACIKNRPRRHTITVDIEYLMSFKGAWIKYSGDTALAGIAWGRITALRRTGDFITRLTLDEFVQMEEGKTYRIRLRTAENQQEEYAVIFDPDYTNTIELEAPVPVSFGLAAGDLFAFGAAGTVSLDLVIVDIDPIDAHTARLLCVDYSPEIFGVDTPDYVIPDWNPHVSVGGEVDSGVPGSPPPAYLKNVEEKITDLTIEQYERPTYTEIVNGFTQAGVTVIPLPLVLSAAGGFRFIALSWGRQTNLSGLREYQLQVSGDAETWYAPRFDGVDWKGTAEAVFTTSSVFITHANIPPAGTEESPEGRILYYRVRQRTMLDAYSEWSAVAGAQTKLADTGDYGVNSISANALKVAELFALFATIGERLLIDPRGISSENTQWAEGATRAVLDSREIAFQFFLKLLGQDAAAWQTMARLGLEGVEASQFFSKDRLYITNNDMAGRRARGYDIGIPFLSEFSEVLHYDTDMLDQSGEEFFSMTGSGTLVGEPEQDLILKATAPYATEARALYGNFRLQANIGIPPAFTIDFWMLYKYNENQVLFNIGSENDLVQIEVLDDEPFYNDEPADEVMYNDEAADDTWYNEIDLAHTRIARNYNGSWSFMPITDGDAENMFKHGSWYHVGVVNTGNQIRVLINDRMFPFDSSPQAYAVKIDVNPTKSLMLIDEVLVDATVAESAQQFYRNTRLRRPWGKLDDAQAWAILDVKDIEHFKTNIFQSPDFAAAIDAILQEKGVI
jgi:hypothetical protein